MKKEPIKTFKAGHDTWEIHENEYGGYKYLHFPFSIAADLAQRIIIKYNEEKHMYDFIAEEYAEIYGSGGWSPWAGYTNELRDICLADAIKRIGK